MPVELKSFNVMYGLYYKRSYVFAKSYVHDDLAAEDIASESLIKLWEAMKSGDVEKPLHLLMSILKNKSLDYLRHSAVRREALGEIGDWRRRELELRISTLQACDPEEIFSEEIQSIVRDTLANMPERTRKVFYMSRFEQMSGKEIAESLGISVKGVDYHIAKALKELRVQLKDYLPFFLFFYAG